MKENKNGLIIYCDMDGVLADFNKEVDAVYRFRNEHNFFKNLQPIDKNVQGLKDLIKQGYTVNILSTSPNARADQDKIEWLKKYLPEIAAKNIIMARPSIPKIDYVNPELRKMAVLLDDYGKNIKEWEQGNGLYAIKITEKAEHENEFNNIMQVRQVLEAIF